MKIKALILALILASCSNSNELILDVEIKDLKKGKLVLSKINDSVFSTIDSFNVSGEKNIIFKKLYFTLLSIFIFSTANSHEGFIENKGQLPKNVIAKKNIVGGGLFVEKGKLTFSFYDQRQLKNFHNRTDELRQINFHAYTLAFQNINNSILIIIGINFFTICIVGSIYTTI